MDQNRIETQLRRGKRRKPCGRMPIGLLLLTVGILLLLRTSGAVEFPEWFFTWPVLLIAIGIFSGIRHGFRGPFWIILIAVGGIFLADRIDPTLNMGRYGWPVGFIVIGIIFLLRPRSSGYGRERWSGNRQGYISEGGSSDTTYVEEEKDVRDFLDVTAVFGGIKKNVLSKTFRGGEVVSFMGGSEIDLTQADFQGQIRIDVTNIFGGTKLVVPSGWDVQSDVTAIFGGVDDKRKLVGVNMNPEKVLILDGTCLFGGIEIRSY